MVQWIVRELRCDVARVHPIPCHFFRHFLEIGSLPGDSLAVSRSRRSVVSPVIVW